MNDKGAYRPSHLLHIVFASGFADPVPLHFVLALTYGLQEKKNLKQNSKILVFDLGRGTSDFTISNIKIDKNNQNFYTLATNSNKFLGGKDFDNKSVDYFLQNFVKIWMKIKKK